MWWYKAPHMEMVLQSLGLSKNGARIYRFLVGHGPTAVAGIHKGTGIHRRNIYDALERRFGRERVFKDVDNIPVGADFGDYIKTILPRCRVALILIGPQWTSAQDAAGRRRLEA